MVLKKVTYVFNPQQTKIVKIILYIESLKKETKNKTTIDESDITRLAWLSFSVGEGGGD